jgi:pre-mRNA-splicing factor ATP-dependent RNA helicase DHX16
MSKELTFPKKKEINDSFEKFPHLIMNTTKGIGKTDSILENDMIECIRTVSRETYLHKRELQKINELQIEIADEERLFLNIGTGINAKELKDINYKREILSLVLDQQRQLSSHEQIMADKYGEKEDVFSSEEKTWEFQQKQKSQTIPGSKTPLKKMKKFGFITENQVDSLIYNYLELDHDSDERLNEKVNKFHSPVELQEKTHNIRKEKTPIFQHRNNILNSIENFQVVIVVAETGSGKTTQLTQYLYEAGYSKLGKIGSTQPRRVAAMSVASRVAYEMNLMIGKEVGYSIRFEDCTSNVTVIKYMTDGILLRELLSEPDLSSYSVIIVDEAHERTLHTDILFGLVKDVSRFRPDLKVIISSATLDATKFSEFFDDAPIYKIPGRMYPVHIYYTNSPEANYLEATVQTVVQLHASEPAGDILVFLTGQEEIEICEESIEKKHRGPGKNNLELICITIYANLPAELQARIFEPTPIGARKVIIATNIAETSLTIPGIR